MTDIALSPDEVTAIRHFRDNRDYPGGYAYVSSVIARHPEFDQSTAFWFEKARLINMNVRSDPADIYIRSVTACGLRWDGKMADNRVVNARMLQQTSDNIAVAVLSQIVTAQAITNVNVFLNQDIIGALASGQTIGGWGGAFYYWNAPFVPPGGRSPTTVGQYILSHPDEREKFVACNGAASLDAVLLTQSPGIKPGPFPVNVDAYLASRLKLLLDGLRTNGQAQAPQFIKDEIRDRAVAIATGRSTAGDPNQIGDYTYNGSVWSSPRVYHYEGGTVVAPTPEHDLGVLKQLEARRAVRQSHQSFRPTPAF